MHLYDLLKFDNIQKFSAAGAHTPASVTQYQIWKPPWKNPGYAPANTLKILLFSHLVWSRLGEKSSSSFGDTVWCESCSKVCLACVCILYHLYTGFLFRILQDKTDQIINTLLAASPSAGGGALPAGMREELTSIKNTQSLVQHQLGDLRYLWHKNGFYSPCSCNDFNHLVAYLSLRQPR